MDLMWGSMLKLQSIWICGVTYKYFQVERFYLLQFVTMVTIYMETIYSYYSYITVTFFMCSVQ